MKPDKSISRTFTLYAATTQRGARMPRRASVVALLVPLVLLGFACSDGRVLGDIVDGDASSDAAVDSASNALADAGCSDGGCATLADFLPIPTVLDGPAYGDKALLSVWGTKADDVWAVGTQGAILHWTGSAWSVEPSGTAVPLRKVWGTESGGVLVAAGDTILERRPGGSSWNQLLGACGEGKRVSACQLTSVWTSSGNDTFAVGLFTDGVMRHRDKQWSRVSPYLAMKPGVLAPNMRDLRAMWGTSANDIWAVGASGAAAHGILDPASDAGAFTWTDHESQSISTFEGIAGSGANDVWIVGTNGAIRHWTNAPDKTWEIVPRMTYADLHAVWVNSPSDVWAVGDEGTILHFDGSSWRFATAAFSQPNGKPDLYGVWASGPDDVWIVGVGVALRSRTSQVTQ